MRGAFPAPHSCIHLCPTPFPPLRPPYLHFASDSFFVSSPVPGPGRPGPHPRLQSSALLGSPAYTLGSTASQAHPPSFPSLPQSPTEAQGLGGHLRLQRRCGRRGWEWSRPAVSTAPVPRAAGLPGEVGNTLALRHVRQVSVIWAGNMCPNLGPQDLIWRFQIRHQKSWGSRGQMWRIEVQYGSYTLQ